ncbi:hypothetical protein [Aeromonas hydrophila]
MEVNNKNHFKTREWWMLIVLIVLIQWVVHFWSTEAMSSSEMVSYVSFAGTLVSTILAVLAIIYSFIQSASQQTSSEIISREVYRLQDIVNAVNSSAAKVNESLEKLPGIIDNLEKIPHTVSDTVKQGVTPLKEQNDGMQAQLLVLTTAISGGKSPRTQESLDARLSEKDKFDYIKAIQICGLVLSSHIISKKDNFKTLYKEFTASLSQDYLSIVDEIFISSGTVLSNFFVQKKFSAKYNETIEKSDECSDEEWSHLLKRQESMLSSFIELKASSTLNKYLPEEVVNKLYSVLES